MDKGTVKDFEYVCRRAVSSLPAFFYIFLADEKDYVQPAEFHYLVSDILLQKKKNFAVEAFRESAKSTYVLRAFPLYCLFFPYVERQYIVIIKKNQRQASKVIKDIAFTQQSSALLKHNIKKVHEQSAEAYEIELKDWKNCRVRIEAYGKGGAIRGLNWNGKRPDIVILDDVQDFEDSLSPTVLEKDWEWFMSDVKPLGKNSRIFIIGNNLGEKCLIERVFEHAEELEFQKMKIPAIDDNGNPTWEEKFSLTYLENEKESYRKTGKLDVWYRERLCESLSEENRLFKREYFRYYAPAEWRKLKDSLAVYTTVDLAISQKESADYTAICTVAVDSENRWYILDCRYGRWNPSEQIEQIFSVVKKYNPRKVGIEKVQYQAALEHFLQKDMRQRNIFFTIEELKASKQKELRIQALQPRFKAGNILFPDIADWLTEMEAELLMFPKSLHDDLIDALAYVEQIAQAQRSTSKTRKPIPKWRVG